MSTSKPVVVYGASGYTGRLVCEFLREYGLGSVSETADGDPPHGATGCPFQAWSVAEVLRTRPFTLRI